VWLSRPHGGGGAPDEEGLAGIEAAGIEPALADPDRPGTILELVGDVAVVLYLLGSAQGQPETLAAIHGPRLERLAEHLVDTPVRGFVYEAEGSVGEVVLAGGAEILRAAERTWRIPVAILREGDSALEAVSSLISPVGNPK